jgi:cytochrome bd-type quinol oxidase subunit 1
LITGWLSVGLSIASGAFVAVSPLSILGDSVRNKSFIRILLGTMTFLCVAVLTGWLAAELQNYPLGIFGGN